ncbi:MAG: serine--tRNA ligase, partial [Deltaproteobacteria bacterium]
MLELRFIREHLDLVIEKTARRDKESALLETFATTDQQRRGLLAEVESLKNTRNSVSEQIAVLKKDGDVAKAEELITAMRQAGQRIKDLDEQLREVEENLQQIVMAIPNLCDDTVPVGRDEQDNQEIKCWGSKPQFSFSPKPHWELGEELGILDFERAAKISGARFALLTGFASRLERALINFMLDLHTQRHGYTEVLPPFLVNTPSMTATGQLPKFAEDLFRIEGRDLFLIPTAEVPVTNIHRDETLNEDELPRKYTAYTPCFR